MMKTNLKESSVMTDMQGVLASKGIAWTAVHATDRLFSSLGYAIAEFLTAYKKPEQKIAVVINNEKGNFLMGAYVEHHVNEENKDEDNVTKNFSFVLTFDEKDIEDANEKYSNFDNQFQVIAQESNRKHCSLTFVTNESVVLIYSGVVELLLKWLDNNAKENDVVELELPDVFTASVELKNGIKEYAIEPIGKCKRIAKGDIENQEK